MIFGCLWSEKISLNQYHQIFHLGSAFYSIAIMNLKTAILLEWLRIFVPPGVRGNFFVSLQVLPYILKCDQYSKSRVTPGIFA